MTRIAIQYLENAYPPEATPQNVRERLRRACQILPIESVLLGWHLPPALEEAVASEAEQQRVSLYRWHPLLASDSGAPQPDEWKTIGATGAPIPGFGNLPEFTFFCPNHPAARDWIAERIQKAAQRGIYQGIFFDRMRWPSPAEDPGKHFGCFCPHCQALAAHSGLDLEAVRRLINQLLADSAGAQRLIRALFRPEEDEDSLLEAFFAFRSTCITRTIFTCANLSRVSGLSVGLDCFSPSLMRMVGQDLSALSRACDWAKLMIYPHTFGPAGIPYELHSLTDWLVKNYGFSDICREEGRILGYERAYARSYPKIRGLTTGNSKEPNYGLGQRDGLQFVCDSSQIQPGKSAALEQEVTRGKAASNAPVFAGLALVEMEKINDISDEQFQADLDACKLAQADGLALSWDLWLIPNRRLETIAKTFFA